MTLSVAVSLSVHRMAGTGSNYYDYMHGFCDRDTTIHIVGKGVPPLQT